MKNKGLIIALIVLLSIIAVSLVIIMVVLLNGNFKMPTFSLGNFNYKTSTKLVLDETYDNTFDKIKLKSTSSDIHIKVSEDNNVRVVVYGEKENTKLNSTEEELSIEYESKPCVGFCFNNIISKIEIYLPRDFDKEISIVNNYGDIEIAEFKNSNINIEEDCGDVLVTGAKDITVKNDYGNVRVRKADKADIKESAGDVKIDTVNSVIVKNSYGNIKIGEVLYYIDASNDCGDITIDKMDIEKNSQIKLNLGDVKINKINDVYIEADTNLGKIDIRNNNPKSDINLKISNDCGDIKVYN